MEASHLHRGHNFLWQLQIIACASVKHHEVGGIERQSWHIWGDDKDKYKDKDKDRAGTSGEMTKTKTKTKTAGTSGEMGARGCNVIVAVQLCTCVATLTTLLVAFVALSELP